MTNENQEILEWYNDRPDSAQEYILVKKSEVSKADSSINPPTPNDLNPVASDSPQSDIQQDIINKEMGYQLTQKSDPLIAVDKANTYKAYALTEIIEKKLKIYNALAGTQEDDPIRKEGIANDLKTLSRELSDVIGAL